MKPAPCVICGLPAQAHRCSACFAESPDRCPCDACWGEFLTWANAALDRGRR